MPLAIFWNHRRPDPEDDIAYATTTARPELERDWKSGDKEDEVEEEEEEDSHNASWRRDAGGESMEEEPAATGPAKDWRETAFSEAPARKMRDDSWAPQKEISGFQEAAETEQRVGAMVKDAPVSETRVPPPAIAPFTEEAWVAALKPSATVVEAATMEPPARPAQEQYAAPEVVAKSSPEVHAEIPAIAPAKVETPAEPAKPAGSSWFSSVPSPWDAEGQKGKPAGIHVGCAAPRARLRAAHQRQMLEQKHSFIPVRRI